MRGKFCNIHHARRNGRLPGVSDAKRLLEQGLSSSCIKSTSDLEATYGHNSNDVFVRVFLVIGWDSTEVGSITEVDKFKATPI